MSKWASAWSLVGVVAGLLFVLAVAIGLALGILVDTWEMEQRLRQRGGRDRRPDPWFVRLARWIRRA